MARIHATTDTDTPLVVLAVDVAVDTLAVVAVPTWVHLAGDAQAVADTYSRRYAALHELLRGDQR